MTHLASTISGFQTSFLAYGYKPATKIVLPKATFARFIEELISIHQLPLTSLTEGKMKQVTFIGIEISESDEDG